MNRKIAAPFISDILKCNQKIQSYLGNLTLAQFKKNQLVQDAIIHNIEIIGEACNHLADEFKDLCPDIPWRDIKAMRNRLTHEYWYVKLSIVWNTAKKDIPNLVSLLQKYIAKQ